MHRLFRHARRLGGLSAVGGGLVLDSGAGYALRGEPLRTTSISLVAARGLARSTGLLTRGHFRRRERAVLAALVRGQPLPAYAERWLFLPSR